MGKKRTSGAPPAAYTVGRGKPPLHTRFPPGRSANPGGRKKGSLNVKTQLRDLLSSEIILSEHGRPRKATMLEAILLSAIKVALAGNQRAVEYLLDKAETLVDLEQNTNCELDQEDEELLEAALRARRHRPTAAPSDREADEEDGDDVDAPSSRQRGSKDQEGRS